MGGFVGGCTKGGGMQEDTKGETGRGHGRRFREKHLERDIAEDMLEMHPFGRRHALPHWMRHASIGGCSLRGMPVMGDLSRNRDNPKGLGPLKGPA